MGVLGCFLIFVVMIIGASTLAGYFYWTTILKPQSLKAGIEEQVNNLETYKFESSVEVVEKTDKSEEPEEYHFESKGSINYKGQQADIKEKVINEEDSENSTDYDIKINKRNYYVWDADMKWYVKNQFLKGMWDRRYQQYNSYFNYIWDKWIIFQNQEDKYTYTGIEEFDDREVYKWVVKGDIWVQKLLEVEVDKYIGREDAKLDNVVLTFLVSPDGMPTGQILEVDYRVSDKDTKITGNFKEIVKYNSYNETLQVDVDEEKILAQMNPNYVLNNVYSEVKNVSDFILNRQVNYSNNYTYDYSSGPYSYSGGDKTELNIKEKNRVDLDKKKAEVSIEWDHNLGAYISSYYGSTIEGSGKGKIYANDYTYWAKFDKNKDYKRDNYGFFDSYVDYPLHNAYGYSYYVRYFSYLLNPFKELDDVASKKITYLKKENIEGKEAFVFEIEDAEIIKTLNNDGGEVSQEGLKYESSAGYSSQTVDIKENYWRIWIQRDNQLPLKIVRYYKYNWKGNSSYGVSEEEVSRKDIYTFEEYNSNFSIEFPKGVGEYDSNGEVGT